ncbi:MAG: quinone oxidoreductase [Alphaproteobacteria bacterium]
MVKAIRIHETGGSEVFRWEDIAVGEPGPGEIRIRQTAIGVNYLDTYHRRGIYPIGLPAVIGNEGAGIVEALGKNVRGLKPGDRIAYGLPPVGSYSEARIIPAWIAVRIPEGVSDQTAAAMMLKGMTAEYLLRRTYRVKTGDTVLIHAAAGGVGLILCQWAKHLGATVIGTVSTDEKADLARHHGCDHAIIYGREDFVRRTRDITNGQGVAVVYDGVGKDTVYGSMRVLRRFGVLALYGQASGDPGPIDMTGLRGNAGYFTRPGLMVYNTNRKELLASTRALFDVMAKGAVKIAVNQAFPLREAAEAHRALEGRRTTGAIVLLP